MKGMGLSPYIKTPATSRASAPEAIRSRNKNRTTPTANSPHNHSPRPPSQPPHLMNAPASRRITPILAIVFAAYVTARALEIAPSHIPRIAIVALDVISALAFALVDGTRTLGIRGILIFAAICIFVGNIIENLGVATGFPFGHYYFAELMGPKLFYVPVLLGLAYIGMAYVS